MKKFQEKLGLRTKIELKRNETNLAEITMLPKYLDEPANPTSLYRPIFSLVMEGSC